MVNGFRYCLTMIDRFSRWPVAVPMKDCTAETVAESFFTHWVSQFGTPLTLTTDQGPQFESALFSAMTRFVGCKKTRTSPYHPASNGIVERWHRTLKAALMCKPEIPWIYLLPSVMLGLRTAYKEDLKASPAEMLYGTTLRIPGEFFVHSEQSADPKVFVEKHRDYMRKIRPIQTSNHAKHRQFIHKDLLTCTHVFLRLDHVKPPLERPYSGPHEILERITEKLYKIRIVTEDKISEDNIGIERLKPAHMPATDHTPILNTPADNNQNFEKKTTPQDTVPLTQPKNVKFASENVKDIRGGVDVATPHLPPPPETPREAPSLTTRQPRKQVLQPRELYSLASHVDSNTLPASHS